MEIQTFYGFDLTSGDYRYPVQTKRTKQRSRNDEVVEVTHGHMVSTSNSVLGKPGDGGVIGMLLAGFEPKETARSTDIDNILNDIKEVTRLGVVVQNFVVCLSFSLSASHINKEISLYDAENQSSRFLRTRLGLFPGVSFHRLGRVYSLLYECFSISNPQNDSLRKRTDLSLTPKRSKML